MSIPVKQKITKRAVAVMIGCALLLFANTGIAQTIGYSFYVPMSEDMGINMGLLTYMVTVSSISMMIFCLFFGKLLKKFSLKWLVLVSGIVMGISWLVQASATTAQVVWVAGALRGVAGIFCANMTTSVILLNWFSKGTIMAVINTMDNLAPAVLSVPIATAVQTYGWRTVGVGIAITSIVVSAVVGLFLVKLTPQECGIRQIGSVIGEEEKVKAKTDYDLPGISAKQALRMPQLYMVMIVAVCMMFLAQGMSAHRTAIIMSLNLTYVQAGLAVSVTSLFGVIFQITFGALSDKFGLRASTTFAGVIYILAMVIGLIAPQGILLFGVLYGICTSTMANSSIYPSLAVKEIFGMKDLATISGYVQTAMLIGGIVGSAIIGTVYTIAGNYKPVLTLALLVAATVLVMGLITNRKANRFVERIKKEEKGL